MTGLMRASWLHPQRHSLIAGQGVVLEEGINRSLRFRLVSPPALELDDLMGPDDSLRLHPDGKHWSREVSWADPEASEIFRASQVPRALSSPGHGDRGHLVRVRPSAEELQKLGWALLTEKQPGGGSRRELLLADEEQRAALRAYLGAQVPDDLDDLYLQVLRRSIRQTNEAMPSPPREARSVAVILPWLWHGRQVELERVSMALHYRLTDLGAEQVVANLTPFSLQVFSHTALHTSSPLLSRVAGALTRWSFVRPEKNLPEDWKRMASLNLTTVQQSRDLFAAFESPSFCLYREANPIRAVMSAATSLIVLEEQDRATKEARSLAAGAPIWTVERAIYA